MSAGVAVEVGGTVVSVADVCSTVVVVSVVA